MTEPSDADIQGISDWIVESGLCAADTVAMFCGFCERLTTAGLPIRRGHLAVRALHPLYASMTITWRPDRAADILELRHGADDTPEWRASPLFEMLQARRFDARYRLEQPGPWQHFPFLVDLRSGGATDYLAILTPFGEPERSFERRDGIVCSWLTDRPGGFTDNHVIALQRLQRRFGLAAKVSKRERTAAAVAAAYLGAEAGRRVLDGLIRRGDGDLVRAALWYADMRGSTPLAESLSAPAFLGVLDRFFEATAGSVLATGGQVLSFIGDAVFGVFPYTSDADAAPAATAALAAARRAGRCIDALNAAQRGTGEPAIGFGIGLHMGEVLYGNIGVPERLNLTVIGRAANAVARLEGLTKALGEPIVASEAFAGAAPDDWRPVGHHRLEGMAGSMAVFAADW